MVPGFCVHVPGEEGVEAHAAAQGELSDSYLLLFYSSVLHQLAQFPGEDLVSDFLSSTELHSPLFFPDINPTY